MQITLQRKAKLKQQIKATKPNLSVETSKYTTQIVEGYHYPTGKQPKQYTTPVNNKTLLKPQYKQLANNLKPKINNKQTRPQVQSQQC